MQESSKRGIPPCSELCHEHNYLWLHFKQTQYLNPPVLACRLLSQRHLIHRVLIWTSFSLSINHPVSCEVLVFWLKKASLDYISLVTAILLYVRKGGY